MTDYSKLIDAETWEYIREADACYPPDAVALDVHGQRRVYDAMCAHFHAGYPMGVVARDHDIAGVTVRDFAGATPVVVYLHGGGFVVGGRDSHDDICAEIAKATGLRVVMVDYRLSPENRHPAALEDALAVTRSLLDQGVVLVGDSAGGNLCAAVARELRGQIRGQVLIYPGLGGDTGQGSYLTHAHAPQLTRDDVLFYAGIRHGGVIPAPDPSVSPLVDTDYAGLPPTVAFGAECDPLCDDAAAYAARVPQGHAFVEPGLVHGYLRARHRATRARESFARIIAAIAALAAGDWPYGDGT